MKTKRESAAATAGYIGTGAVEDYHAAHVEHLTAALPPGVTRLTSGHCLRLAGEDGFFSCPACRTNPLKNKKWYIVVRHMKRIAAQK
jgi:hypothetical protein